MALVSVVIPTFNRARWVTDAVESVIGQDFTDWELIVVDDGSTDQTEAALEPYADVLRYTRIPHAGVGAARNVGLRAGSGPWVAFLDSDDLWLRQKLSRQLQALQASPHTPLCHTDEIWIRNGRRVNPRKRHRKYGGWIFEKCLPLCLISPSSVLISRELLEEVGGFDEGLPACEDYDLWLRVTLRYPVLFLNESLIIKTGGHGDQLSRAYWGLDRFRVAALLKILRQPELHPGRRRVVIEELTYKCRILEQGARKRGKDGESVYYLQLIEALKNHASSSHILLSSPLARCRP
jgi:glycosyltransferase involved in cell wall biosynthesis